MLLLRNLMSVFIAAVMYMFCAILFLSVPFTFGGVIHGIDNHGLLHDTNFVLAACAIVGGWLGYIGLRYSATLLSIRMMMLAQRHDTRPAQKTFFAAWVLWPFIRPSHGDD